MYIHVYTDKLLVDKLINHNCKIMSTTKSIPIYYNSFLKTILFLQQKNKPDIAYPCIVFLVLFTFKVKVLFKLFYQAIKHHILIRFVFYIKIVKNFNESSFSNNMLGKYIKPQFGKL